MSEGGGNTRIYIFVLILNLIFPVLGYTFTSFGGAPEDYETTLDPDSLMTIGLNLIDAESHNLSYNSGWVYYTLINDSIRAQFMDNVIGPGLQVLGDGLTFQAQSSLSLAFDSWVIAYQVNVKSILTNERMKYLTNETIIRDYDSDYNWSRFILMDGHHVFITPFSTDGNITKAVFDDAHLNVTIAKSFDEEEKANFLTFIGWYSSLIIGDQSWGLPSVFAWFLRILGALSVYAFVMLTKDLIRL